MVIVVLAKTDMDYRAIDLSGFEAKRIFEISVEILTGVGICIIMSPLNDAERAMIETFEGTDFFAYAGANLSKIIEGQNIFHSLEELKQEVETYKAKYLKGLKEYYLENAVRLTDEDEAYVQFLNGGKAPPLSQDKLRHRKQGSKHIAIVGSHKNFYTLFKKAQGKKMETAVIIDCDLIKPTLDSYFQIRKIESKVKTQLSGLDNTGLNVLLDSMQKGVGIHHVLDSAAIKVTNNLDVILGNYNMYNYEHYDTDLIRTLVQKLKYHYDTVYTLSPLNLYDELTLALIHDSSSVALVGDNSRVHVRSLIGHVEILEYRQQMAIEKLQFYFFESSGHRKDWVEEAVLKTLFKKQYRGLYKNWSWKLRSNNRFLEV